jgi:hypothetical protein
VADSATLPPPPSRAPTSADGSPPAWWREPTAPRIFANVVFAIVVAIVQQLLVGAAVTHRGLSDDYVSAASTVTVLAMLACVIGGWIGFTYSRRPASDRTLLLLGCWGLSSAVGLALLFAFQPSARHMPVSPELQAVADDFCATKAGLSDALGAVSNSATAPDLIANADAALQRFEDASFSLHEDARRAEAAGADELAAKLDAVGTDFARLARALRAMDRPAVDVASHDAAMEVISALRTWPISVTC